jgi:ribosomal protein L16/L10AE
MALRKASAYSKKIVVPFTRKSRQKGKAYIKVVPPSKVVKFSMGDEKSFNEGKYPYHLTVISTEHVQIRHNALEAVRELQTGMALSFGKSMGRSAILKPGTKMFFFAVATESGIAPIRKMLGQIRSKMPGHIKIIQEFKGQRAAPAFVEAVA